MLYKGVVATSQKLFFYLFSRKAFVFKDYGKLYSGLSLYIHDFNGRSETYQDVTSHNIMLRHYFSLFSRKDFVFKDYGKLYSGLSLYLHDFNGRSETFQDVTSHNIMLRRYFSGYGSWRRYANKGRPVRPLCRPKPPLTQPGGTYRL